MEAEEGGLHLPDVLTGQCTNAGGMCGKPHHSPLADQLCPTALTAWRHPNGPGFSHSELAAV